MKKCFAACIILLFLHIQLKGQERRDSIQLRKMQSQTIVDNDTAHWVKNEKIDLGKDAEVKTEPFKPNPTKAVIYSAIFPGLGQIYNKKYWKLPIIYGGYLGLSYAITWNGRYYNDYSSAYRGISGSDPRTNHESWSPFAPGYNPNQITDSQIEYLKSSFRRKRDFYRRNRDLAIIGAIAIYAACMIDAYVDAHLFDFDMSPDLSFRVEPVIMIDPLYSTRSFGLQCNIKF